MKTDVICNGRNIPLNNFTGKYIANIVRAMTSSLGCEAEEIMLDIGEGGVSVYCDGRRLEMEKDFAEYLILNTVKGLMSPLKGIFWDGKIIIAVGKDAEVYNKEE